MIFAVGSQLEELIDWLFPSNMTSYEFNFNVPFSDQTSTTDVLKLSIGYESNDVNDDPLIASDE